MNFPRAQGEFAAGRASAGGKTAPKMQCGHEPWVASRTNLELASLTRHFWKRSENAGCRPKCYCPEVLSHSLTSVQFLPAEAGAGTAVGTSLASGWSVLRVQVLQNLSRCWRLRTCPCG